MPIAYRKGSVIADITANATAAGVIKGAGLVARVVTAVLTAVTTTTTTTTTATTATTATSTDSSTATASAANASCKKASDYMSYSMVLTTATTMTVCAYSDGVCNTSSTTTCTTMLDQQKQQPNNTNTYSGACDSKGCFWMSKMAILTSTASSTATATTTTAATTHATVAGSENFFCGTNWTDAKTRCGEACPSGDFCPTGQTCYAGTACVNTTATATISTATAGVGNIVSPLPTTLPSVVVVVVSASASTSASTITTTTTTLAGFIEVDGFGFCRIDQGERIGSVAVLSHTSWGRQNGLSADFCQRECSLQDNCLAVSWDPTEQVCEYMCEEMTGQCNSEGDYDPMRFVTNVTLSARCCDRQVSLGGRLSTLCYNSVDSRDALSKCYVKEQGCDNATSPQPGPARQRRRRASTPAPPAAGGTVAVTRRRVADMVPQRDRLVRLDVPGSAIYDAIELSLQPRGHALQVSSGLGYEWFNSNEGATLAYVYRVDATGTKTKLHRQETISVVTTASVVTGSLGFGMFVGYPTTDLGTLYSAVESHLALTLGSVASRLDTTADASTGTHAGPPGSNRMADLVQLEVCHKVCLPRNALLLVPPPPHRARVRAR